MIESINHKKEEQRLQLKKDMEAFQGEVQQIPYDGDMIIRYKISTNPFVLYTKDESFDEVTL
ncbi:MAG: hypothetical protein Unbinned8472contig1000_63 [Prokaryotic dsDNA virus sp.]|nr:MAG: hypothetical protein Unbinned8472contig1000_63 [Prokaryotic dsDNA virus sp.]|tara:strand:+ start:47375 stop:47560 length:186 start_codon:yes stop_codon:yes gene_type:complete